MVSGSAAGAGWQAVMIMVATIKTPRTTKNLDLIFFSPL
jgi:hypothetical protein